MLLVFCVSELMCFIVRHIGSSLQDKQKPPSAEQLEMLSQAVQGMAQNLLRSWAWATDTIGMSTEEASDRFVQVGWCHSALDAAAAAAH